MTLLYIFTFLFGTIIGSFLNALLFRFRTGRSMAGRSQCMSCGHTLSWYELIPIASFVLQRRRCRSCGARISWQYPLVELATGVLFVSVLSTSGATIEAGLMLIISALLVFIFVYDLRHTIIPNPFVYGFIGVSAVTLFVNGNEITTSPALWDVLAGPILSSPFFLLWLVSRGRWMGFGDGKLAWGVGWMLGLSAGISAFVLSFWIGAVVGVGLILLQRLGKHALFGGAPLTVKSQIPFAPFLITAALLVFFFDVSVLSIL